MVLSVACGNALLYVFTSLLHLSANMVPIRFGSIDIEVRSAHAGATPNTVAAAVACAAAVGRANDTWHDDVQAGLKFANLMNSGEFQGIVVKRLETDPERSQQWEENNR